MSRSVSPMRSLQRPSDAWKARLNAVTPPAERVRIGQLLDNVEAVDALALAMTKAVDACTTKDGRLDMKDVAAHVIAQMRNAQK